MVTATGYPGIGPDPLVESPAQPNAPITAAEYAAATVAVQYEEWRVQGRWRWLTTAMLILGLAGFVVNQETYAASSFVVRNPGNAFQTGYVEIDLERPGATIITAGGLLAGESATGLVTLYNSGTENIGTITMTTQAGGTDTPVLLSDYDNGLQIGVDRCSEAWSSATPATCPGVVTYNVFACKALNDRIEIGYPATTLKPGARDNLRVRITLPSTADRPFMGLTANIRFIFFATGAPASLEPPVCSKATPTPGPSPTVAVMRTPLPETPQWTATAMPPSMTPSPRISVTPQATATPLMSPTVNTVRGPVNTPGPMQTFAPLGPAQPTATAFGAHGEIATPGAVPPTPSPLITPRTSPTPYVVHLTPTPGTKGVFTVITVRSVPLPPDEGADGPFDPIVMSDRP